MQNAALGRHEIDLMHEGTALVAFLQPLISPDLVRQAGGAAHHQLQHGRDPAHLARADDGRAVVAGHGRGL